MDTLFDIPIMTFKDSDSWEQWLNQNHTDQVGVWIKIAKKDSGIPSVTPAECIDIALCYGWIDGQRRGLDENYFLQKYTPRRKRSLWSKVNIGKVETLIAEGRMQKSGFAEIELAKTDGRWEAAYESQANAVMPDDLTVALEKNQKAREFYETLSRAERYSVLHQLMTARTPVTRSRRLEKILTLLSSNKKP